MVQSLDLLDALEAHAFDLKNATDPAFDWVKQLQSKKKPNRPPNSPAVDAENGTDMSLNNVLDRGETENGQGMVTIGIEETADDDPVEMAMRAYVLNHYALP
jgi:hypothetical protein